MPALAYGFRHFTRFVDHDKNVNATFDASSLRYSGIRERTDYVFDWNKVCRRRLGERQSEKKYRKEHGASKRQILSHAPSYKSTQSRLLGSKEKQIQVSPSERSVQ